MRTGETNLPEEQREGTFPQGAAGGFGGWFGDGGLDGEGAGQSLSRERLQCGSTHLNGDQSDAPTLSGYPCKEVKGQKLGILSGWRGIRSLTLQRYGHGLAAVGGDGEHGLSCWEGGDDARLWDGALLRGGDAGLAFHRVYKQTAPEASAGRGAVPVLQAGGGGRHACRRGRSQLVYTLRSDH